MVDVLIILVIAGILGLAVGYLYRAKKRGVQCVGCPDAKSCSGKCGSCSGCKCH